LRCGDLVLKQTFQLDQPPLCYKAVPTWHLQRVSSFSSNDFTRWSPSVPQKMTNLSGQPAFLYLSTGYRVLAAASIRERGLFRPARPEVRRQFESGVWSSKYGILSNLSKVLEKLILKIHQQDSPPVSNPLQGSFREQVGCIYTAFIYPPRSNSVTS